MSDEPIRKQTAQMIRSALKTSSGTLLLYPDRLSHVVSAAIGVGAAAGVVGLAVANKMAKNKAEEKEAAGGKGVTTIPLAEITEVRKGKQGLQRNLLEVVTSDGTALKFGVKFDQWKPDLVGALGSAAAM